MNYSKPAALNLKEYEAVVSLGNKCPTAMILKELGLYGESFPFDLVPTTPRLILKYLQDPAEFYPEKSVVRTKDGVWFGHFDTDGGHAQTVETLKRRFARLIASLENKKKVLFVYSSEADIYNEMNNRYNDNYADLGKLVDYLIETYQYQNFKLLCVHVNKTFPDTPNMANYTIRVPEHYFSDDMRTHTADTTCAYRAALRDLLYEIQESVGM